MSRRRLAGWVEEMREAARRLARRPAAALLAASTLAVGMAAVAGAVAVGDALFVSPIPGLDREARLVRVRLGEGASYPEYRELRDSLRLVRGLTAFAAQLLPLQTAAGSDRPLGVLVSPEYFSPLGVHLRRGRAWSAEEA